MPNPSRRGRVLRDPVHGYVDVPDEMDPLVRCAAVQRLRNITQNARAVAGFPSMTGSRFEHALGTMHLAVRAWHAAWVNAVPPAGQVASTVRDAFKAEVIAALRDHDSPLDDCTAGWVSGDNDGDTMLWADFERLIGLVVGAVGLLHDVGHPPFSHTLEPFYEGAVAEIFGADAQAAYQAYRRGSATHAQFHEWAGLQIFDAIPAAAFANLPRTLIRRVLADRSGAGWAHCLHSVIDGQFDVDRLDYLLRDAANAGTEYGSIDTSRLVNSLELHHPGPGNWRIGLGARAVSSFETLLIQRAQHYRWVMHHPSVVASGVALARCTADVHALSRRPEGRGAGAEAVAALRNRLPDLDYIAGASRWAASDPESACDHEVCADDHACYSWLRSVRPLLAALGRTAADPELRRVARSSLALLDVFDTFAIQPIPAWRNYQEFLARAEQNPDEVEKIIQVAPAQQDPAYLRSQAGRDAVRALRTEVPARLNAALDVLLRPTGQDHDLPGAEARLAQQVPTVVDAGGAGCWLLARVPFLALQEDVANIWRGDEQAMLSEVSPYPLALAAIEVMRPHFSVFFVPFDGGQGEATTVQRREVGRLFFQTLADWATLEGRSAVAAAPR